MPSSEIFQQWVPFAKIDCPYLIEIIRCTVCIRGLSRDVRLFDAAFSVFVKMRYISISKQAFKYARMDQQNFYQMQNRSILWRFLGFLDFFNAQVYFFIYSYYIFIKHNKDTFKMYEQAEQ